MSDWKKITLGDFIDVITDYHSNGAYENLKANITLKYEPDFAIMIRTLNFESNDFKKNLIYLNEFEYNYLSKSKVKPYDLIMNKIANPGSVYLMPKLDQPVSLAMNLFLIRFNERLNQKFMFYLMKVNEPYIKKFANGTTTKTITKDSVRGLNFKVPSLSIQERIAYLLYALDSKIELNNRINTELEAMAKTLYDYWFVQFDFPDANGKPYKTSGGKMVYNATLKREIPEGWYYGTLEDLGQIVGGSTPSTTEIDNFCKDGTPWITPNDLSDNQGNKFITRGATDVSVAGIKSASLKKYPIGSVLLSSRAPIGYMAIARNELTTNQGFKSFIPNKGYSSAFIFYAVTRSLKAITQYASGSTFKEISASVLKTVKLALPQKIVSDQYTEAVSAIFTKQDILEQENVKLVDLRDYLLPMLMNGQVTVTS